MMMQVAYPVVLFGGVPSAVIYLIYVWMRGPSAVYTYPLTGFIARSGHVGQEKLHHIMFALRSVILISLIVLASRPQLVDSKSVVNVNGVDIVMAIDVSGSMELFDDPRDRRSRIEVAKKEAIDFIDKRPNDAIAIGVFGADAVSLMPLTLDKRLLKNVVGDLKVGIVNAEGTALATGLAMAINRLRTSTAKSKIIIFLTDGRPFGPDKLTVDQAIALAKNFGIKIYTIGIGSANGGYTAGPFGQVMMVGQDSAVDMELLKKISNQTGARAFEARKPQDLRDIYATIDKLEKTESETTIYNRYFEAIERCVPFLLILLFCEWLARFWFLRGVW